ncbi:DUF664 domain-containing protein [Streptomyces sp. NBC_01433]|uniref:mycothiol transferase n=1 Tax=Streptomyces sp. NBC_01433 TaxID=2903864 RepID=UPI002B1CB79D|nr:DUF664 domain-containing protein [Streptomyces sp. NBC_01433]
MAGGSGVRRAGTPPTPPISMSRATTLCGGPVPPRRVIVHMIAEYARHNGHADPLRERVDGATGV